MLFLEVAKFLRTSATQLDLTIIDQLLLYTLAIYIGKNDKCWVSQTRLGQDANCSSRHVKSSIRSLAEKKLINVIKVGKANHYSITELIRGSIVPQLALEQRNYSSSIDPGHDPVIDPTLGKYSSPIPLTLGNPSSPIRGSIVPLTIGSNSLIPQLTHELTEHLTQPKETKKETIRKAKKKTIAKKVLHFETWWQLYPRKVKKQTAFMLWKKNNLDEQASLLIGNLELRQALGLRLGWSVDEKKYIPHPSTFLNQQRWTDELENLEDEVNHGNSRPSRMAEQSARADELYAKVFGASHADPFAEVRPQLGTNHVQLVQANVRLSVDRENANSGESCDAGELLGENDRGLCLERHSRSSNGMLQAIPISTHAKPND